MLSVTLPSLPAIPAPVAEPRRRGALLQSSLVRFVAAGVTSTTVDMAVLYLLHGVFHVQLTVSTFAAVLAGFVTNFLLNRIWAFESTSPVGGQTARYLVMAVGNWLATVLLVDGLVKSGVFYLLARAVTLVLLSAVNFLGYKHWVFRKP